MILSAVGANGSFNMNDFADFKSIESKAILGIDKGTKVSVIDKDVFVFAVFKHDFANHVNCITISNSGKIGVANGDFNGLGDLLVVISFTSGNGGNGGFRTRGSGFTEFD